MPTVLAQLEAPFRAAIRAALEIDGDPQLAVSQNENFGDYQSSAAMVLAKAVSEKTGTKTNPRAIAELIKAKLDLGKMASEPTIAGPGFINVRLNPTWMAEQLQLVARDNRLRDSKPSPGTPGEGLDEGTRELTKESQGPHPSPLPEYRAREKESQRTIVVDYSGPNVAKEMHVGHLRSTIIGDAISRVLEFQGHKIIRQNHIGDWGTQFGMLIECMIVLAKNFQSTVRTGNSKPWEATVEIGDLNGFYQTAKQTFDSDPAFAERARNRVVLLQGGDSETYEKWRQLYSKSLEHFDIAYDRLHVLLKDTDIRGESSYNADLPKVVAELKTSGVAVESEGAVVIPVPGFDAPLMIRKSDGGYLYGTTDLAAIRYRVNELHANRIVYTHDSRQQQHFAQVFWAAKKAGWVDGVELDYAPFGTMLGEDGKPFKTRTGGTVKLKELLDEAEERAFAVVTEKNGELPEAQRRAIAHSVGIGAVKYSDLSKDRVGNYVFSFDKMLALDGNTAPYLQYAHARIRSIFRKSGEKPPADAKIVLEAPAEISLARHILRFGEVIELVSRELKPHHLCSYLYELAARFSRFYENCPVLQSEPAMRASRLAICDLTANTLKTGLGLLGIDSPEQM